MLPQVAPYYRYDPSPPRIFAILKILLELGQKGIHLGFVARLVIEYG